MKNKMQIEHIFNAVDKMYEKDTFIDSQEFKIGYWKRKNEDYNPPSWEDLGDSDYLKQHYYSLVPSSENSLISKYDEQKLDDILEKLGDELIMISGDFWGIQKFIFDGITTSKAAKILRSRSALIQLITFAVTKEIEEIFQDSQTLLFGAGKFLILAKREGEYLEKIKSLQNQLDEYFLKNYFGQNGFIIAVAQTSKKIAA